MDDNSTDYEYSFDELNESLTNYGESLNDISILNEFLKPIKPNCIQKYIVNKLYSYYLNYKKIISLSSREYTDNFRNYFTEYYVINYEWMENFLKYYQYDQSIIKLIKLIEIENNNLNVEELDKKINEFNIEEFPGNENIIKNGLT